jgi:hypothetical protein
MVSGKSKKHIILKSHNMKKNNIFISLFLFSNTFLFSQNKITISTFKDKYVNNEILKIITSGGEIKYKNLNYCDLYFFILDNDEGSANLNYCDYTSDIYIALKDVDSLINLPRLYVLKNIYSLDTKSLKFEEVDNSIIMSFESTIAKKGKKWEKDLKYDYTKVKNIYTIDFKKIIKLNNTYSAYIFKV